MTGCIITIWDTKRAVYKIEHNRYKNDVLDYPYVFEIIAIPYDNRSLKEANNNFDAMESQFKGSVNYSISPRGNLFEGKYRWHEDEKRYRLLQSNSRILKRFWIYMTLESM